jgi:hypothetical protein
MFLHLDLGDIFAQQERAQALANELLARSAEDLAAMAYSKVVELAQSQLKTSRQEYLSNLSYEQAGPSLWTVTLNSKAMWIEEGMPRHEMVDDLLKNAKVSKKGVRYKVIPFPIKGAANTAPAAMPIRLAAMGALRRAKINMKDIERDVDGRAKIGGLHKLDVMTAPIKTAHGPHMGQGALGMVRQGLSGTPFLKGLSVQQRMIGNAPGNIQKTAMTFRVVTSLHKGSGRWVHPGVKAKKLMDQAFAWAENEWESVIKPEILSAIAESTR